jgi:probable HAF family extracellular repeat protein
MLDLGTLPGANRTRALDISNSGVVVGTSGGPSTGPRAFIWTASEGMVDLNLRIPHTYRLIIVEAHAINARGQILVRAMDAQHGHDHEGASRILLLTPSR